MRRWWLLALTLVATVIVVWQVRRRVASPARRDDATATRDRPTPVLIARVERRDVPLYLEGIGTVAANATVTVRARVDGRLDAVLFREGQAVRQGDVLAQIDPRPFELQLRQALAVVARDRAQLQAARVTLARNQTLVAQHFIAQADLDAALAAVAQLDASVRADEAQVASARLSLDFARVTSPIDGVTGIRLVDAGNLVHASDANGIVVVTQVDPIAVLFTLPQDDLSAVATEMSRGPLTVDALSRDGAARLARGRLVVIDNQVNESTATIRLKALFANPTRALWPSQFVKARLLVTTRRGALVVPAAAVQPGPQGSFVYAVSSDQRVAMRPVRVERVEGELALIADGLSQGDAVVTEGQSRLRAGARVQPRSARGDGGAP